MATTYDFPTHKKGDTMQAVNFTVTVNSVALDLTGAIIKMDLRKTGVPTTRYSTVNSAGLTITNAAAGQFSFDEQIVDITATTYDYDIEITLSNGEVYTYIQGTWAITQDITYD